MNITFNDLPHAVSQLYEKLDNIERLLLEKSNNLNKESDQLLTIKEAAEMLSLSVPTVYGLVSHAEVPFMKKGKRLYFSKQELTDWIKSGRKKTTSEIEATAQKFVTRKKI